MNDDEMLATLRSSLTGVKESLADVHLDRSADEIRAGARGRRLRRGLAGAGAGGTALGVGLALAAGSGPGATAAGVHVNLAAWSVNTQSSGLVYVDIRELREPGLLRQTLARAGVPAIVTFGEFCTGASGGDSQNLQGILGKSPVGGGKLTINPAAIPAGSELSIGITQVSEHGAEGFGNSFALVKEGSRLTCGNPSANLGAGAGKGGSEASGAPKVPGVRAGRGNTTTKTPAPTGSGG
jgi:hypothetical protein